MIGARAALAVVSTGLALALAWQLGERHGAARAPAPPAGTAPDPALLARVATLEGERDMNRATIESLRIELERAGELSVAERAELALYRRIGEEGGPDGLAIDALERRQGETATLFVTLVQARGRERVRGRIEVRAVAAGAPSAAVDGREAGESAGLAGETVAIEGGATARGSAAPWQSPFDFRFFETVEVTLSGFGERFPLAIEVTVLPDDGSHRPFRQRFRREEVPRRE